MGGVAKGWELRWRGGDPGVGIAHVRFSHQKHRYEESTGERDPRAAAARAAEIYARVVSGKRKPGTLLPNLPLDELAAEWIVTLQHTHTEGTQGMYETHFRATLVPFFKRLDQVTTARIAEFARTRLGTATRRTMRKERNTLRAFLRWLVVEGTIDAMPEWPDLPGRSATGTRVSTRKREPVEVTPQQAADAIALLPVASKGRRGGTGSFAIRARITVAWETGLRPTTLDRIETPTHYRKGSAELVITDEIDKIRFGRTLPLTDAARAALDSVVPDKPGLIFGKHDLRTYLKAAGKAVGLPKEFSPYDLRHGRTTEVVEKSGNLVGAAYLFGHKQVTTTAGYVKPNRAAGQRALDAAGGAFWGNAGAAALPAPSDDRAISIVDPQNPKGPETLQSPDPVGASGFEPPTPRPPAQKHSRSPGKSRPAATQKIAGNGTPEPPPGTLPQPAPGADLAAQIDRLNSFGPPLAAAAAAELRGLARCGSLPELDALEQLEAAELAAGAAS
jgi:integrase